MTAQVKRDFLIAYIIDRLTEYLIEDNNISLDYALKLVYHSNVYQQLQNIDGELYIQSPSYVYELLKKEYQQTHPITAKNGAKTAEPSH
jgi:predicted small secreted protein